MDRRRRQVNSIVSVQLNTFNENQSHCDFQFSIVTKIKPNNAGERANYASCFGGGGEVLVSGEINLLHRKFRLIFISCNNESNGIL